MKHLIGTLALVTALAAATCAVAFRVSGDSAIKAAMAKRDALEWLRSDFHLTDAQFEKIKQLHVSYSVECEAHCNAIQQAALARNRLKSTASDPATLATAERKLEELRQVCETAIAAHVRRCAAEMSPEAGQRYLALVLPRIADFDHQAPPDLRLGSPHRHP